MLLWTLAAKHVSRHLVGTPLWTEEPQNPALAGLTSFWVEPVNVKLWNVLGGDRVSRKQSSKLRGIGHGENKGLWFKQGSE